MCGTGAVTSGGGLVAQPPAATPATASVPTLTPEVQAKLMPLLQELAAALASLGAALGGASAGAAALAPAATPAPAPAATPSPAPATTTGSGPTTAPAQPLPTAPPLPAAPAAPVAPSAPVSNARQGVLMIGDSLSVGTKQYFTSKLAGQPVTVDATSGISLAEGMRRYDAVKDKPRVVEMGLFTNNAPGDIEQLRKALDRTVADARARGGKVVWATIHGAAKWGSYDKVNAMIRDYAARNPDAMGLVDWEQMVSRNPSYLAGDQLHGTAAGYQARAQAFADAAK